MIFFSTSSENAAAIAEAEVHGIIHPVSLVIVTERGKTIDHFKSFKLFQSSVTHHEFTLVLGIMSAVPRVHPDGDLVATHQVDRIYIVFDYDFQDDKVDSNLFDDEEHKAREIYSKESTKEENDARPFPFFRGSINVGNAALHKNMTAGEFKQALAKAHLAKKGNPYMYFMNHHALPSFYDCGYYEATHPFQYVFHINDKGKIEEFQLDIMDSYKKKRD